MLLGWSLLFGVTLDIIWRNRNELVFSQKSTFTQTSIINIRNQVDGIVTCIDRNTILKPQISGSEDKRHDRWKPPAPGFITVFNNVREAGCAGILRDSRGKFIFAFSHRLDACSALEVEVWSVYHGVSIAWGKGFTTLEVEVDSTVVVHHLVQRNFSNHHLEQILRKILAIGGNGIEISWNSVGSELNSMADLVAKESYKISGSFVIFDSIPDFLVNAMAVNGYGPIGGPILME